MKFLADENTGYKTIKPLRKLGFDINSILEISKGFSDLKVLSLANKDNRILITCDKDFGEMVYVNKLIHSGIILLRLNDDSSRNKLKVLGKLFKIHPGQLTKSFTVVTESRVKIRKY